MDILDSQQITVNSRTSTILDNQRRSVVVCSLGKEVIIVPSNAQCYISVVSAEILNGIVPIDSTTDQTVIITTDPNYPTNKGAGSFASITYNLQIPTQGMTYTPSSIVSSINGKKFTVGTQANKEIKATLSNNRVTLSVPAGIYIYINKPVPFLGIDLFSFGNSITATNLPFLQQKYLLVGSSFKTERNKPLCKIPVNAALNSFILYSPNTPFPIKMYDDQISTFQISILSEDSVPINNNYCDWSITLQFDIKLKNMQITDNGSENTTGN